MYQFEIVEEGYILEGYNDITYASEGLLSGIGNAIVGFFKGIGNIISKLIKIFTGQYSTLKTKMKKLDKYYAPAKNMYGDKGLMIDVKKLNSKLNSISNRLEKLDYKNAIKTKSESFSKELSNQTNKDFEESNIILDRYKELHDYFMGKKDGKINMHSLDDLDIVAKMVKSNIDVLTRAQGMLSSLYNHLTKGDLKDNKEQHAKYNMEFLKILTKTYTNVVNSHKFESSIFAWYINNIPLTSPTQVSSGIDD